MARNTDNKQTQHKHLLNLLEFQERINAELEEARKLLLNLISKDNPEHELFKKYNLSVASYFKTRQELGGDYFATKEVDDHIIANYMWDFSGHGITAAINTFRLHSLIESLEKHKLSTQEFLTEINQHLYSMLNRDQYATMFYSLIDIKSQKLTYAASGNPHPYLISFKNKKIKRLDSTGFPLGITQHPNYKEHIINFSEWDSILLYSDALIETLGKNHSFFNPERFLINLLNNQTNIPNRNKSQWVLEKIRSIFDVNYAPNLQDDLTLCITSFS